VPFVSLILDLAEDFEVKSCLENKIKKVLTKSYVT
jgi:hypothetical protein